MVLRNGYFFSLKEKREKRTELPHCSAEGKVNRKGTKKWWDETGEEDDVRRSGRSWGSGSCVLSMAVFIEHLLFAIHFTRQWGLSGEQSVGGSGSLEGSTYLQNNVCVRNVQTCREFIRI